MAWSYSDSLSTDRDKIRLKIGDTDTNDQILPNETIDALLTEHSDDVMLTTISCVRAIIAKYSRKLSRSAVGMSADMTVFVTNYQQLLAELIKQNRGNSGVRYASAFSTSRKETIESDSNYTKPFAAVGRDDYPGSGQNSPGDDNADDY
tara:strand:+ start:127 stop:573 length:447 start_codon:yes stop_codon:yes gene_type:complete